MTKLIKICQYVTVAILLVVSTVVQASGATKPSDFVELKEISNPKEGGKPINYVISRPLPRTAAGKQMAMTDEPTLVVYFHDQGSSVQEPYKQPERAPLALSVVLTHRRPLGLVSVPAGKSWGIDKDFELISQCVNEALVVIPAREIVLMGQQMGAAVALNYAAAAPPEIKEKIIGVACARPVGDLAKLYEGSKLQNLQLKLRQAMGGVPLDQMQRYKERSFNSHINELGNVKVGAIVSVDDFIFPSEVQEQLVKSLKRKKIPVKVIELHGNMGEAGPMQWSQALDFCLFKGLK